MTKDQLLALLESLSPEQTYLSQALAFLRVVVKNNPNKSLEQLEQRKDVQQALKVIQDWVDSVRKASDAVVVAVPLPDNEASKVDDQVEETLDKFEDETLLENIKPLTDDPKSWAAQLVLRMTWLVDWLRKLVEYLMLGTPYKMWISRLADNTCSYCRHLHGTVLPIGESFAPYAEDAGFTRVYGGLFAPPLHPHCACLLLPVTQIEYDSFSK